MVHELTDEFLELLGWDDEVPTAEQISVHPNPNTFGVIAVAWQGQPPPSTIQPTFLLTEAPIYAGFWVLANPIDLTNEGTTKPEKFAPMVEAQILGGLGGRRIEELRNPLWLDDDGQTIAEKFLSAPGETWSLWDLKMAANRLGWHNSWNAQGRSRGGLKGGRMKSKAQQEARRAAIKKAHEALRRQGDESAAHVLSLVAQGLSTEALAEALDIAPASVETKVRRARQRLGNVQPLVPKAAQPAAETITLDELEAL